MKTRGLGENSLLALAGDGAAKAGALVVVVVAARFLSVSEFAVVVTALAAAGVIGSLLDLGAGTLLTRDGAKGRRIRGALFLGLLRVRLPAVFAALLVAPLVGLALGRPVTAIATAVLGVTGAFSLSLLGLYRSCQDIRPEAIQRLSAAALSIVAVAVIGLVAPSADVLLVTLAAVTIVTLVPLVVRVPRVAVLGGNASPTAALRAAAPIGLLALATVAYYRSGTLVLAGLADAAETAMFGMAASVAFGLLMLPNAITTALLPRLAAEADFANVVSCARRALGVTFAAASALGAAAAAVVPATLPLVLGSEYSDAGRPFAILCVGIPLIAASGVIGTTLLSVGRLRPLGLQVAASLAANLVALAVLVPVLGAEGAALATIVCEAIGLAVLLLVARRLLPGLVGRRPAAHVGAVRPHGATAS